MDAATQGNEPMKGAPPAAALPARRVEFLGCPLDLVTSVEVLQQIREVIARRGWLAGTPGRPTSISARVGS